MTIGVDVIQAALKLLQLPDRKCFTSWQEFLKEIPQLYGVEIPTGITNVTIGNTYPSDSERDHLWIRTDNSGNFVGFYLYITGTWRLIYPLPDQLFLIVGDSRMPPDGYTFVENDPRVNALQLVNLKKIWSLGGTAPDWYTVFHVTFTGF